ncbi:MAG: hypothetical protein Q8930_05755 [Bacillota bacterium]|nr:hypothetical protein [Bacillota bacterium]
MVFIGGNTGGTTLVPFFFNGDNDAYSDSSKIAHDMYNVYVNKDYVGKKVVVAQGERVEDINSFLKVQGFDNLDSELVGNSYKINCSPNESKRVKDALSVYLSIR